MRRLGIGWKAGLAAALVFFLTTLWHFTPMSEYTQPHRLFGVMRDFSRDSAYAFWVFAFAIGFGNLILVPINVLLIAVAMVFPGWKGFLCGMLGANIAALLAYGVGSMLGAEWASRRFGAKFEVLSREVSNQGTKAVVLFSLVPIAPNIVTNLVSGVCRIPLWKLFVGTTIGFLPGLVLINLLGREMRQLLKDPSINAAILVVGIIAMGFFMHHLFKRYKRRIKSGEAQRVQTEDECVAH